MRGRTLFAFALAVIVAAVAGFIVGFGQGGRAGVAIEHTYRGVIATQHITALRQGRVESVISALQSDVDNGLFWGTEVEGSRVTAVVGRFVGMPDLADVHKSVSRMTEYRAANPVPDLSQYSRSSNPRDGPK